ncbi:MAG: Ig-like domain-containing protein [Verrucomicrobia bacterium]|nr:Ig-like domain-containing protein [Verrucomicrobiota bacterium]
MKRILSILLVGLLANSVLADAEKKYPAQLTLRVVDDAGAPVSKAEVVISTFSHWISGEDFGRNVYDQAEGVTDTNGTATVALDGHTGKYKYMAHPPEGYYWSPAIEYVFTNVLEGRWSPWNPVVEFTLKRVVDPIPMYAKRYEIPYDETFPVEGEPVGFDLMKGDWVEPYGRGQISDFLFKLDRKPQTKAMTRYGPVTLFDDSLTVSFSNDGDGIQPVRHGSVTPGQLPLPRQAPEDEYKSALLKRTYQDSPDNPPHLGGQEDGYFFRVRTRKDAEGNILSALYGKVYGDFEEYGRGSLRFTYYLNPTPNDRNMEFDPSQNLFTDLRPTERVTDP